AGFDGMQRALADGCYARPALVEMPDQAEVVKRETFAPILYVMKYRDLDEAIALHNGVPQGLASSIFTNDMREAELFISARGSDCGIANVNIGPSGAEIGGAFGGEKETGGGRESGSDSWRAYMRRQTNTINYGSELPLAQGIRFDVAP
ncbi:MAG: aldehyde dehydrogenase family protein, partial [Sphingomicrobium sp.]